MRFFFLGIGGIGMSALARFLVKEGNEVSGYDRDKTELTKKLEAEGIGIQYEFDHNELTDPIDIVVYTPAIKEDQKEFRYFKNLKLPMKKRSELLMEVLSEKKVIAIAGTHGKTSTSAILAHILHSNNIPITAFIGGVMNNYNSNFIHGSGEWVIIEADEFDRSFHRLFPSIALIQAMDADHLDIYGTEFEMIEAYRQFTRQIDDQGHLFVQEETACERIKDDWNTELSDKSISLMYFGSHSLIQNDLELNWIDGKTEFNISKSGDRCSLAMPGVHNVKNALGAVEIARLFEIEEEFIAKSISSFTGIQRRFEYKYQSDSLTVIDDYAHHPKEVEAAIMATRALFPERQLTVIFQPHLYTRTRDFMIEFAEALHGADEVILTELYPAREHKIEGVNSQALLELIDGTVKHYVKKSDLTRFLSNKYRPLILNLGAGDVYKHLDEIIGELKQK